MALPSILLPAVVLTLITAAVVCAGQPSTTNPPTTKPAPPKPIDRNSVEMTVDALHVHFHVPKTWQRKPLTGTPPEGLFMFDPAPASKKPERFLQMIQIYFDRPTAGQKALKDAATDLRAALKKKSPDIKFVKDAAAPFAGRAAWTFQWIEQTPATLIVNGKEQKSTMETDRAEYIWLEHGTLCQFAMYADVGLMPSLTQKAESAGKTITFDQ